MLSFRNTLLSSVLILAIQAHSQMDEKKPILGLFFTYGNTSFFPHTSSKSQNILYSTNPNPLLSGQFRYAAFTVEKNMSNNFIGSISIGYSNMLANITLRDTSEIWSSSFDVQLNEAVFIEPGIAYEIRIDSGFSILPGVAVSVNATYNKIEHKTLNAYDTQFDGNVNSNSSIYATLNPKLELRFMPSPKVCLSVVASYLIGLSEVFNVTGQVKDQAVVFPFSASYSGSGVLLAVKAGYLF